MASASSPLQKSRSTRPEVDLAWLASASYTRPPDRLRTVELGGFGEFPGNTGFPGTKCREAAYDVYFVNKRQQQTATSRGRE